MSREAMQQALEALEQSETTVPYEGFGMAQREAERKHQAAITALRAALAEPEQEPVAWDYGDISFGFTFAGIELTDGDKRLAALLTNALGNDHPAFTDLVELLFAARGRINAPTPRKREQEPVMWRNLDRKCVTDHQHTVELWKQEGAEIVPLYATPTPRKPEPSAVKHMMQWVEHLKRLSDDGQHMNIPGLSSGACWELAAELEQFIKSTAPTPRKPLTDEEIDALRYRWIKTHCSLGIEQNGIGWSLRTRQCVAPDGLRDIDAAIDAAIKEQEHE